MRKNLLNGVILGSFTDVFFDFPARSIVVRMLYDLIRYILKHPQNMGEGKKPIAKYLNYDFSFLTSFYSAEHHLINSPYVEVVNWVANNVDPNKLIKINVKQKKFILKKGNDEWNKISQYAFDEFKKDGKADHNGQVIRLSNFSSDGGEISLQPAGYFDQVKSSLVVDFSLKSSVGSNTIREILAKKYKNNLPDFSEQRLAQTVGIAVLLFYPHEGSWIPYIVRRAANQAIYSNDLHCTASGAAKWPKNPEVATFDNFFTEHMFKELEEEVGLSKADIAEMKPIALCKEMLRPGKPQIFYAGITMHSRGTLQEKRKNAIKRIKRLGLRQEVEEDSIFGSTDVVLSADQLILNLLTYKTTFEGIAAVHYGLEYLKINEKRLKNYLAP